MTLSIIVPVLNSHEVMRRHWLHWAQMGLPTSIELIYVDDGSDPPLGLPDSDTRSRIGCRIRIHHTHDCRPWTWALARNAGARRADGDYLLMTDVDYILRPPLLNAALGFRGDKMRFKREFGVLDEHGQFTQDIDVLRQYGLTEQRIAERGVQLPPHPNNFVMRRDLFWDLGGYREDLFQKPYPQREDGAFKAEWAKALAAGRVQDTEYRPTIYMFPNGQFCGDVDFNPFGLFHGLSRKTERNPWHARIVAGGSR